MYGFRLAALLAVSALAGCSGGGPFALPAPSGIITEQVVGQSAIVPATTLSMPLQVQNGFSLVLSELHYTDVFSATLLSHTAPNAMYTVAMDSTGKIAIFTPTGFFSGDVESVQLKDVRGNVAIVFFQNIGP